MSTARIGKISISFSWFKSSGFFSSITASSKSDLKILRSISAGNHVSFPGGLGRDSDVVALVMTVARLDIVRVGLTFAQSSATMRCSGGKIQRALSQSLRLNEVSSFSWSCKCQAVALNHFFLPVQVLGKSVSMEARNTALQAFIHWGTSSSYLNTC